MKNKRNPYVSIFRLFVGLLAIVLTLVIGFDGENTVKWIITLGIATLYVVLGIAEILGWRSGK